MKIVTVVGARPQFIKAAPVSKALYATRIAYYPQPLHLTQPCHALGYQEGVFPISEKASRETLSIPLYPEMTDEQMDRVVAAMRQAVAGVVA